MYALESSGSRRGSLDLEKNQQGHSKDDIVSSISAMSDSDSGSGSDSDSEPNSALKTLKSVLRFILSTALNQWFLLLVGIFIGLAYKFPNFARAGGTIHGEYTLGYGAVAVIFLISGLSMPTRSLWHSVRLWRAHLAVQSISFLVTPSITFGIVSGIQSAHNPRISEKILAGMVVASCTPTTIASNVVMTRQAHGNDKLALIEVCIGNLLGCFISPALVQMFFRPGSAFAFANPAAESNVATVYGDVLKHLGIALFAPLAVGQVLQNVAPRPVERVLSVLRLAKWGSVCLALLLFSSFSTAFHEGVFEQLPTETVLMNVFMNIGLYVLFTCICLGVSRPAPVMWLLRRKCGVSGRIGKMVAQFYYSKKDTVAVMLCGAAKSAAVGVALVSAQYEHNRELMAYMLVPLVLYQGEQILVAQLLVPVMRRWVRSEEEAEEAEKAEGAETKTEAEPKIAVADPDAEIPNGNSH